MTNMWTPVLGKKRTQFLFYSSTLKLNGIVQLHVCTAVMIKLSVEVQTMTTLGSAHTGDLCVNTGGGDNI